MSAPQTENYWKLKMKKGFDKKKDYLGLMKVMVMMMNMMMNMMMMMMMMMMQRINDTLIRFGTQTVEN